MSERNGMFRIFGARKHFRIYSDIRIVGYSDIRICLSVQTCVGIFAGNDGEYGECIRKTRKTANIRYIRSSVTEFYGCQYHAYVGSLELMETHLYSAYTKTKIQSGNIQIKTSTSTSVTSQNVSYTIRIRHMHCLPRLLLEGRCLLKGQCRIHQRLLKL